MQALYPEFDELVLIMAKRAWPDGYDVSLDAPHTMAQLTREYEKRGRITVYSGASDNTIFGSPDVNIAFRAWHDAAHLIAGGVSFNLTSEYDAMLKQCHNLGEYIGYGTVKHAQWCNVLLIEIMCQAKYYSKYGTYVHDQREFHEHCLVYGIDNALMRHW